jgi:hypothetical protein
MASGITVKLLHVDLTNRTAGAPHIGDVKA